MHFETLQKEIKCVLSFKESNFNEKNGSKFSHLLTVRAELVDPDHPPLTVSLTLKCPFFYASLKKPHHTKNILEVNLKKNNLLISYLKLSQKFNLPPFLPFFSLRTLYTLNTVFRRAFQQM